MFTIQISLLATRSRMDWWADDKFLTLFKMKVTQGHAVYLLASYLLLQEPELANSRPTLEMLRSLINTL
jgi:hypothetical protein